MKLTLGRSGWLALVAAMATLAPAGTTLGATYTWLGNGSGIVTTGSWFTSGNLSNNWSPSGTPLPSGSDLEFNFTGVNTTAVQNGVASVQDITFVAGSGQIAGSSALTVTGNIVNNTGSSQTIGASGNLNLNGSGKTIDGGTGGLVISKVVAGNGSYTIQNSVNFSSAAFQTFSGSMAVASGATLTSAGGFSSGAMSLSNGGGNIALQGMSGNFLQTGGTSTFNGQVGGNTQLVDIQGGSFTVTSPLGVGGDYQQSGASTVAVVPYINGTAFVSGGSLEIATQAAFGVVQTGGTVSGPGGAGIASGDAVSVANAGSVLNLNSISGNGLTTTSGATVNYRTNGAVPPNIGGNSSLGGNNFLLDGSTQQVAFDDLTNNAGNTWNIDFQKTSSVNQQVVVNNNLVYGGNLALNLTTAGTAANGANWEIFNFPTLGSQSGTLAGVTLAATSEPAYAGLNFGLATSSTSIFDQRYGAGVWLSDWTSGTQRFIFDQKTGTLTVVPEPSTIVFAGIGAAMLGWQTWAGRRRKARMKLIDEHTRKLSEQRGLV